MDHISRCWIVWFSDYSIDYLFIRVLLCYSVSHCFLYCILHCTHSRRLGRGASPRTCSPIIDKRPYSYSSVIDTIRPNILVPPNTFFKIYASDCTISLLYCYSSCCVVFNSAIFLYLHRSNILHFNIYSTGMPREWTKEAMRLLTK